MILTRESRKLNGGVAFSVRVDTKADLNLFSVRVATLTLQLGYITFDLLGYSALVETSEES